MGISLYVTQGIFLLLAARDPLGESGCDHIRGVVEYRSCWCHDGDGNTPSERQDLLVASAVFGAIGAVLITLPPRTQPVERHSETAA
jgi:hypothetical protein